MISSGSRRGRLVPYPFRTAFGSSAVTRSLSVQRLGGGTDEFFDVFTGLMPKARFQLSPSAVPVFQGAFPVANSRQ
ncbi:MAG: hypothetical protein Q9P01_01660 [Anaerolineae bacterium]|nr:hypothetical protein [Anaerolineae bacterium]